MNYLQVVTIQSTVWNGLKDLSLLIHNDKQDSFRFLKAIKQGNPNEKYGHMVLLYIDPSLEIQINKQCTANLDIFLFLVNLFTKLRKYEGILIF
jgi:hypothetical protein